MRAIAQTKPASSRATATHTLLAWTPRLRSRWNLGSAHFGAQPTIPETGPCGIQSVATIMSSVTRKHQSTLNSRFCRSRRPLYQRLRASIGGTLDVDHLRKSRGFEERSALGSARGIAATIIRLAGRTGYLRRVQPSFEVRTFTRMMVAMTKLPRLDRNLL
jgi:hypothetical protein